MDFNIYFFSTCFRNCQEDILIKWLTQKCHENHENHAYYLFLTTYDYTKKCIKIKHNIYNMGDESNCKFVSSRGLLKICDKHNRNPQSSCRDIDNDILDNLKDYDVIHICSWLSLSIFMTHYAPRIDKKIIIVSNDSDFDGPIFIKPVGKGDEINTEAIINFLNSDFCIHWFTQNCTIKHSKISPIPIGMDYHTFSRNISIPYQEEIISNIASNSIPFYERALLCYGNFHFSMDGKYYSSDRYDCFNNVNKNLVHYEPCMINRESTWKNQSNFSFVLCPAGGGYDCHRTWEALILGCIPIIKKFHIPLEEIYEDLPILLVNNWNDITPELLQNTITNFKNRKFNMDKLTLQYWKDKIFSYKLKTDKIE